MKTKQTLPLLLVTFIIGLGQRASAAVLVAEDFNYTTGNTVNANSLNGGAGFTGAWATNNMPGNGTGTVSSNQLGTFTGNSLFINPTSGDTTAFRQLSGTFNTLRGASNTLWLGYDIEISLVGTRYAGLQMNSGYFSPASSGTERLFIGKGSAKAGAIDNNGGSFNFNGLNWNLTGGGARISDSGVGVVANHAVKLVLKLDFAGGSISGWVLNPNSTVANEAALGTPSMLLNGASVDMSTNGPIDSINAIRFGSGFNLGSHTTSAGYYDTFRLGTELSDVFAAIPEPSSVMLLGLAAGSLALLRRRTRS
jgi:hypothetical protein